MGWNKLPWLLFAALSLAIPGRTEWAESEWHDEEDPQTVIERMEKDMWPLRLSKPALAPDLLAYGRSTLFARYVPAGSQDQATGQNLRLFLHCSGGEWQREFEKWGPELHLTGSLFSEENPSSSFSQIKHRRKWAIFSDSDDPSFSHGQYRRKLVLLSIWNDPWFEDSSPDRWHYSPCYHVIRTIGRIRSRPGHVAASPDGTP